MNTGTLIFLLLFGLLQGLLLAIVVLIRKNVRVFHFLLGAYLVVLLLQVAFKVISKVWVVDHWLPGYQLSYALPLLYGPLCWQFTRYYLYPGTRWIWKNFLHFSPFLFYVVLFALRDHSLINYSISHVLFDARFKLIVEIVSLSVYHLLSFTFLLKTKVTFSKSPELDRFIFVQRFITISFCLSAMIAVMLYFIYITFPVYFSLRWSFLLIVFFIYWLSMQIMKKPAAFESIPGNNSLKKFVPSPTFIVHHPVNKYHHSGLKPEEIEQIFGRLSMLMDQEKVYRDSLLTIGKLARQIGCQKHHLSQVLNGKIGKTFHEYLSDKRIAEARVILCDNANRQQKIASVAYDAGFNSLSSFNDCFKKSEGMTPSEYRRLYQRPDEERENHG